MASPNKEQQKQEGEITDGMDEDSSRGAPDASGNGEVPAPKVDKKLPQVKQRNTKDKKADFKPGNSQGKPADATSNGEVPTPKVDEKLPQVKQRNTKDKTADVKPKDSQEKPADAANNGEVSTSKGDEKPKVKQEEEEKEVNQEDASLQNFPSELEKFTKKQKIKAFDAICEGIRKGDLGIILEAAEHPKEGPCQCNETHRDSCKGTVVVPSAIRKALKEKYWIPCLVMIDTLKGDLKRRDDLKKEYGKYLKPMGVDVKKRVENSNKETNRLIKKVEERRTKLHLPFSCYGTLKDYTQHTSLCPHIVDITQKKQSHVCSIPCQKCHKRAYTF